ncbi:MAG: hypothetical protein HYZ50_05575 [Deltaproteobacteria bacterium]|nr:hypothetical protein [Deltaproteobacteria bacterium]
MSPRSALLAAALLLVGCNAMLGDFDKYDKNYAVVPLQRIAVGSSKSEVESTLGQPVNVVGSKQFSAGVVEVWQYERWAANLGPDSAAEIYWLYFWNGELVQWGRPGDWQREADAIYEIRTR